MNERGQEREQVINGFQVRSGRKRRDEGMGQAYQRAGLVGDVRR